MPYQLLEKLSPPFLRPLVSNCCPSTQVTASEQQKLQDIFGWRSQGCQEPWNNLQGSRNFSILKLHNPFVNFTDRSPKRERGGWEGHKQMETKFQSFYSKQLLTMYKYCILAHMKIQLLRHPEICSYTLQDHSQRVDDLLQTVSI